MAEEFANKIKRLELENFTCFGKVAMDFSPGINVFIGENGTGKTHLLKVLYAGFNWSRTELRDAPNLTMSNFTRIIPFYFGIENIGSLIRKVNGKNHAEVQIELSNLSKTVIDIGKENSNITSSVNPSGEGKAYPEQMLYLTPQEMLSWYSGFSSLYNRREISFDKTYYDLAEALGLPLLKNSAKDKASQLIVTLENALNLKVIKKDEKFFVSWNNDLEHEASISATGINKLAQLIYLIMNGSLTKDTILFWDEPEANLNPKYILVVSKFLQTLAKAGCQIFVATHDYLLPYDLSLSKEYQDVEGGAPDMKFFSLYKGENGTAVEEGATMPDLNHDPIHEGLSQHNNREDVLFRKSLNPQA